MGRQWDFYTAPGGGKVVQKAIKECITNAHELATLTKKMDKVAELGTRAPEVRPLGDGVWELKFSVYPNKFRLAFAMVDGGMVALGLHFFKKDQPRQQDDVDLAKTRFRDWKTRPKAQG